MPLLEMLAKNLGEFALAAQSVFVTMEERDNICAIRRADKHAHASVKGNNFPHILDSHCGLASAFGVRCGLVSHGTIITVTGTSKIAVLGAEESKLKGRLTDYIPAASKNQNSK